jgi:hypothetical protein
MNFTATRLKACVSLVMLPLVAGATDDGQAQSQPEAQAIEKLDGDRYRIGSIEVDKRLRSFLVPGSVLERDQPDGPIEFIAVTRGGTKAYEAIFELETTAVEFNLACILIGLDSKGATLPQYHFDATPLLGQQVELYLEWQQDGDSVRIPAAQAVTGYDPDARRHDWVYTGSFFGDSDQYMAEVSGALVGFVHDMDSVIQHRIGLGIGDYGAITANTGLLPPPGTPVTLTLQAKSD